MTSSSPRRIRVSGGRVDRSREWGPDTYMVCATRMQERRSRRAVAALSAALLIVVGLLGARHEAEVAHVRDQQGDLVHAQKLAEDHEAGRAADMHSREAHRHAPGACALIAALHGSAISTRPPGVAAVVSLAQELGAPP